MTASTPHTDTSAAEAAPETAAAPDTAAATTPNSEAAIVVTELSRHFGGVKAVDGLSMEVHAGEIYGFLGPNGAGKTTAVRMLSTLLSPTSGRAVVAGYDVVKSPHQVRQRIGAALQNTALDEKMTGMELLRIQGRYYGLSSAEIAERVKQLEPILEMDAIDRKVATYSGGMKRRLDVAMALIHSPSVLFLDEPTTGLDPTSRARVWEEIRHLNEQIGVTIFLTTQYLEEADELASRVGIISHGQLVANDSPERLKQQVGNDVIVVKLDCDGSGAAGEAAAGDGGGAAASSHKAQQVLGELAGVERVDVTGDELAIASSNGAATISPVALALSAADLPVTNISLHTPTLDDVFFSLTGARIETDSPAPAAPAAGEPAGGNPQQ